MLDVETTVVRKQDLTAVEANGKLSILNVETGKYMFLNPVAARIYDFIEKPIRVKEIVARLTDEYDVDEKKCTLSVVSFLEKMHKSKIIDIVS
jgi:response regulator RpfG family c-di-GMP phosphodiesterase